MKIFKRRKTFRVRNEVKRFTYFPIFYKSSVFWLSRVKIEKSFNGMTMRIINIQKIQ